MSSTNKFSVEDMMQWKIIIQKIHNACRKRENAVFVLEAIDKINLNL